MRGPASADGGETSSVSESGCVKKIDQSPSEMVIARRNCGLGQRAEDHADNDRRGREIEAPHQEAERPPSG